MNFQLLLPLAVTVLIAVAGWILGHKLNARRDRINKHREIRLKYLIDAYRNLVNTTGRTELDSQETRDQRDAVADIQLFGTREQIDHLLELRKNSKDINPLINSLRDELRKELDLPPANINVHWIRLN